MSEKVSLQTNCDSVLIPCPARLSAIRGACRDGFARIGLVEKKVLTYSVLCWLVTSPRPLREGVNVLGCLVVIPHPLREREQSCLSRKAKATNAGVGVTQEHLQSAPLCEGKLFSDTLSLCSRYRFENLSFAPFRLNLASLTSPLPQRARMVTTKPNTFTPSHKGRWDSRPMCHAILSPISVQERRTPKIL